MSYDVNMVVDTGATYPASVHDCGNYTYNVGDMFRASLGGDGLRELQGLAGEEATPKLRKAIAYMEDHPVEMRGMNPANGWGNYEGALNYLRAVLDGCVTHPKAVVSIT